MALLDRIARDLGCAAYAVGGTVRDVLLGREPVDVDIAVAGDAAAFAEALARRLDGAVVRLEADRSLMRVVPRGGEPSHVDIATLRGTLEDDLRARDFTLNALAAPPRGGEVVDVTGGAADLSACVLRMTSEAALRADPLRLLRAVRIAAELALEIEPATREAVRRNCALLRRPAAERRRDELAHIFELPAAYPALGQLDALGLLDVLLPEVTFGRGVTQPDDWHAYDVFEHNMRTVAALDAMLDGVTDGDWSFPLGEAPWRLMSDIAPHLRAYFAEELSPGRSRRGLLKLAGLLHDVGKPQARTVDDDGRIRFLGHADSGATIAARVLRRLRFASSEVRAVALLVKQHLRPVQLAQVGERPTRRALWRFYRELGEHVPSVLFLSLADGAASAGPRLAREGWNAQVTYMNGLLVRSQEEEGIVHPPRLLTGHDVTSLLGLPPGPRIGQLLAALEEAQAAGEVTDRGGAVAFIRAQQRQQE